MAAKSGNYQFNLSEIVGIDSGQVQYMAGKIREHLNRLELVEGHVNLEEARALLVDMHDAVTILEACADKLAVTKAVAVRQLNRGLDVQ